MGYKYNSPRYISWRNRVFYRDHYSCQLCGTKGTINAHHIKRKKDYPHMAYRLSNGLTLCTICHEIINEHEKMFEPLFRKIISTKLTLDYVYEFFSGLSREIVKAFKSKNKWLLIPKNLVNKIQQFNDSSKKRSPRVKRRRQFVVYDKSI